MKRHDWGQITGAPRGEVMRMCLACGAQTTIKPGTAGTMLYRMSDEDEWKPSAMACTSQPVK